MRPYSQTVAVQATCMMAHRYGEEAVANALQFALAMGCTDAADRLLKRLNVIHSALSLGYGLAPDFDTAGRSKWQQEETAT